jgi:hypothetical protein
MRLIYTHYILWCYVATKSTGTNSLYAEEARDERERDTEIKREQAERYFENHSAE